MLSFSLAGAESHPRVARATIGGFYFWASGRSVALPASRYNYSSDWTPLLVRLSLAGMAASLAAPTLAGCLLDITWSDFELIAPALLGAFPASGQQVVPST